MIDLKLNIAERVALMNILPPEGNIVTLRIIRELQTQLAFTEKELKEYKITNRRNPDGSGFITWDSDFSAKEKDVTIGEAAKGIIAEQLKAFSERGKLRVEMLTLYEKFVEAKKN